MLRGIALLLVALVVGLGVAACGDDSDSDATTTEETTTDEETTAAGQAVFVANCGSCHMLSDAGTTGTIGPTLDDTALTQDEVELQVREGGGGMPAFEGQLSDDEIEQVAAYVTGG
jgi:mono/diheme cytochrome c family protein